MIINSLRQHWPARKLEWLMAGFAVSWGLYVLFHPSLFTDPATATTLKGLTEISAPVTEYPALAWGGVFFLTGLLRATALFINGAYTRTPLIRVLACFVTMFIVMQIIIGLWNSGVPNSDLVVYPWFIVADLLSAYRAAIDVVHAEKQRGVQKETYRADRFSANVPA